MKLFRSNFYSFTGEKHLLGFRWAAFKRYLALILWCFVILSLYFSYDIPGSLQNQIMAKFKLSAFQFSYLYSVYSWPNIIMCFIGGFLVDRVFGPKIALIVYTGIASLGMLCFITGGNSENFILMLVGRFIIGIGCESAAIAVNNYAILWFSGKELNMVFAIVMNIGRIGSSLVFEGSEPILKSIEKRGVPEDQVLGHTLIALGSVILIAFLGALLVALLNPEEKEEDKDEKKPDKNDEEPPKVKMTDVLTFPAQYWLLCFIIDIYINCVYSFLGLSQKSFTTKFKVTDATANGYVSFFSFFGAALSPILGIYIDKYGRNLLYINFSIFTGIIAFAILAFTYASPYVSMFFLAISIASLLSSAWALFSYIIPDHQIGTAFGIVQAIMNIMLSIGSVSAGAISDNYGPDIMQTYLLGLLIATVPLSIALWAVDLKQSKVLNMSTEERNKYLEKRNATESNANGPRKISTISNCMNEDKDKSAISSSNEKTSH